MPTRLLCNSSSPWRAAALAATLLTGATASTPVALAQDRTVERPIRHITVTATGRVSATPDIATISTGVETTGETAEQALEENSRAMRRVIARMRELGVPTRRIATENLSVRPNYDRRPQRQQDVPTSPRIVGYTVTNSVRIRVDDIGDLGEIVDAVTRIGANRVGQIRFSVRNAESLRDRARERAVANARRRAELYVGATNARLGRVLMIREGSAGFRPPQPMMMEARSARSVPIARGEQELSASVTITWALR
ncbi:MAG: SIMPL domain-containing protein [Pseudomonadota bacterium]